MRRFLPLASVLCLTVSACARSASESEARPKPEGTGGASTSAPSEAAELADFVVGEPMRIHNLAIFPISSKTVRDADRFITLDEGLRAGTVEIYEVGARPHVSSADGRTDESNRQVASNHESQVSTSAEGAEVHEAADELVAFHAGADVNHLVVVNRGDKPLYLMPGEVIVGGYQDRTIAEEMILAATGKPVSVNVYCVEHGRWGGRDVTSSVEIQSVLYPRLASDADDGSYSRIEQDATAARKGKFIASAGTLNKESRLAAQSGEGQQSVWDNVAVANASSRIQSASGAFTANFLDNDVLEKLQPYLDSLNKSIADQERIIGVAVAINGKIEAVDVFESTPLFQKVWPRLLKGYALDAVHAADSPDADKSCRAAEATAFIEKVRESQVDATKQSENGLVVTRHNSKEVMGFSARTESADRDGAAMMGGMGFGGFGGAVHSAGFSK